MLELEKVHSERKEAFISNFHKLLKLHPLNQQLLQIVEEECNFVPGYHYILFPSGLCEVVNYFQLCQDQLMLSTLSHNVDARIRDKIFDAVKARIFAIDRNTTSKIVKYFTHPANMKEGIKSSARTCDIIWRYANDKSTDFNYYTKRGLLLGVYLSAIAHYVSGKDNTENFIKHALDKASSIGVLKKKLKPESIREALEKVPIVRLFL